MFDNFHGVDSEFDVDAAFCVATTLGVELSLDERTIHLLDDRL